MLKGNYVERKRDTVPAELLISSPVTLASSSCVAGVVTAFLVTIRLIC